MGMAKELLIFDWLGTLAQPESGETFRKPGEKYQWIKGEGLHSNRKELLEHMEAEGAKIAVAYNNGALAFGITRRDEEEAAIFSLLRELDFHVPFLVCPYHEKKPERYPEYAGWRMPLTDMLGRLHALYPDIPLSAVTVVGDREEERQAAETFGARFIEAEAFFVDVEHDLECFIRDEQTAGDVFDGIPF